MSDTRTNITTVDVDLSDLLSVTVNSKELQIILKNILERLRNVENHQFATNNQEDPHDSTEVVGNSEGLNTDRASSKTGKFPASVADASDIETEEKEESEQSTKNMFSDVNKACIDKDDQWDMAKRLKALEDTLMMANNEIANLRDESENLSDAIQHLSNNDDRIDYIEKELDALKSRTSEGKGALNTNQNVAIIEDQKVNLAKDSESQEAKKKGISSFTDIHPDAINNGKELEKDGHDHSKIPRKDIQLIPNYDEDIAVMKQHMREIDEKLNKVINENNARDGETKVVTKEKEEKKLKEITHAIDVPLNVMKQDFSKDTFYNEIDGSNSDEPSGGNYDNSSKKSKFDSIHDGGTVPLDDRQRQPVGSQEHFQSKKSDTQTLPFGHKYSEDTETYEQKDGDIHSSGVLGAGGNSIDNTNRIRDLEKQLQEAQEQLRNQGNEIRALGQECSKNASICHQLAGGHVDGNGVLGVGGNSIDNTNRIGDLEKQLQEAQEQLLSHSVLIQALTEDFIKNNKLQNPAPSPSRVGTQLVPCTVGDGGLATGDNLSSHNEVFEKQPLKPQEQLQSPGNETRTSWLKNTESPGSIGGGSYSGFGSIDTLVRTVEELQRMMAIHERRITSLSTDKASKDAVLQLSNDVSDLKNLIKTLMDSSPNSVRPRGDGVPTTEDVALNMTIQGRIDDLESLINGQLDEIRASVERLHHNKADTALVASKAEHDYVENSLEKLMHEVEHVMNDTNAGLIDTLDKSLNILRDMINGKATKGDVQRLQNKLDTEEDRGMGTVQDGLTGVKSYRCLGCNRTVESMRPRPMGSNLETFMNRVPNSTRGILTGATLPHIRSPAAEQLKFIAASPPGSA